MQMVEICLPDSAYATKIHIASRREGENETGWWCWWLGNHQFYPQYAIVLYPPDSFLFTVPLKKIKGFDARKRRSWSTWGVVLGVFPPSSCQSFQTFCLQLAWNSWSIGVSAHAYADCKISGQQPAQLHKEFPRTHEVGHSKDNVAHFDSGSEFIKWSAAQNHVCVAMYLTQPLQEMPSFPTQCLSGGNETLKASDVESLAEIVPGWGH